MENQTNDTASVSSQNVGKTKKFALNPKDMQDNKVNIMHVTESSKDFTRHITVAYRWTRPDVETGDDSFRHVEYGATIWKAQNGQKAKMPYSRRASNHTAVERLKKRPVCVDLHFNRLNDENGDYSAKLSIEAFENEVRRQLTKHGVCGEKNKHQATVDENVDNVGGNENGHLVQEAVC